MTEAQFTSSSSPEEMLHHLTEQASPRKLRLYAIGCCYRIWELLHDERCRHAVSRARDFADGRITAVELESAGRTVVGLAKVLGDPSAVWARSTHSVGGAAWATTRASAWVAAWDAAWDARTVARDCLPGTDWEQERTWQATLLHDLFGNPFRPPHIDPAWRTSNDAVVDQLARVIYNEDRFGDLPILADALEEAGCTCSVILEHCRGRRNHYRGCWVVDAILGYT
jgi:hypothetical protein